MHKKFFKQVGKHLKKEGRLYLAQANYGAVKEMKQFAHKNAFQVILKGRKKMPGKDPRIFYAFEFKQLL